LWRVVKQGRTAAKVPSLPHGGEVRVMVSGQFLTSSLFRDDPKSLSVFLVGMRQTFEAKGWSLERSSARQ